MDIYNAPEIVDQLAHWGSLLGLNLVIQRDKRDGAWLIVIIWKDAPDIFFEIDYKGRNMTFYSNVLTELKSENSKDKLYDFLYEVMNRQSLYQTVRVCAGKLRETETHMIKIYSKYRATALNMQLLSNLIMDAQKLLEHIKNLIVEFKLPEVWREMEGEANTDKYDLNFHFCYV
jgi:hypothetical protein